MLPGKTRFALLLALVLFVPLTTMTGQPPAGPAAGDAPAQQPKLADLLQEGRAAAGQVSKQTRAGFMAGQFKLEDAIALTHFAREAALVFCTSDDERIKVLSTFLETARDHERIAATEEKAGQGRPATALLARLARLRVEVELMRLKGRAGGKDPGAERGKVEPPKAGTPRVLHLPATIEAFESVRLHTRVSGILEKQTVDIGDRVKRGQALAVLDAREQQAQLRLDRVALHKVQARVHAAKSRVSIATAELAAATAAIKEVEATVQSTAAWVKFRELQLKRMKELLERRGIEESVVNESQERYNAAVESAKAAQRAVEKVKAQAQAQVASTEVARADLLGAEADVQAAQLQIEKSEVRLSYATLTAPFDGVVTRRTFFPGDFIKSGDQPGSQPLLTVVRTDRLRVIVLIPDNAIPYIDRGQEAVVELDALPGKKWSAKVARVSGIEDPKTRSMRIELDLPNPDGSLYAGMYGTLTIHLPSTKNPN